MERTRDHTARSAHTILRALFRSPAGGARFPTSVLDVGCGRGDWLRTARALGATRMLGLDAHGTDTLADDLPRQTLDLTRPFAPRDFAPHQTRGFALSICVEVAEHLPARAERTLVASLARSAPICVFSAAVPGQGGIGHVNERPPAHWAELFARHRFRCVDPRLARMSARGKRLWDDARVEPWYRQNLLVFIAPTQPVPRAWRPLLTDAPPHLVHPEIFAGHRNRRDEAHTIWDLARGAWVARRFA